MRGARPAAHGDTDKGRARAHNEDRFLCEPELGIFAVIDGVGGESGGELAAGFAAESLKARLSRRTTDTQRLIREAIALANTQIYDWAQKNPLFKGMSCVLTVAVLDGERMTVGHVGDSRLYLLGRGRIDKVTRDHSPIGMREDKGEISETDAMQHPRRNEILRDVGSAPHQPDDPEFIEFYTPTFAPETAVLLCSDGLSDMLTREEIRGIVERHAGDPRAAVEELIDAANDRGGKDNISVVLVEGERYAESVRGPSASRSPHTTQTGKTAQKTGPHKALDEPLPWRDEPSIGLKPLTPAAPAMSAVSGEAPRPLPTHGAASVPGRPFPWRALALALVGLALLGGLWFWRDPLLRLLTGSGGEEVVEESTAEIVVRQGASIQDAIDRASVGQTVEVLPGVYDGPVRLRDGVSLVCRTPRGAVIRAAGTPAPGSGSGSDSDGGTAVVTATDLSRRTVFSGFRIDAGGAAPAAVGLRLSGANVEARDLEIVGAGAAGVVVTGDRHRPLLDHSYVHNNRGAGLVLRDGASPSLRQNLISRNAAGPGVEICATCRPALEGNRFVANGAPAVRLLAASDAAAAEIGDRVDEIFDWNAFGAATRNAAIQVRPAQGTQTFPGTQP